MRYRVTIEGDVLEGDYHTAADAVFGLMRQWVNRRRQRAHDLRSEHSSAHRAEIQRLESELSEMCIVVQHVEEDPVPDGHMRIGRACKKCGGRFRQELRTLKTTTYGTRWVTRAGACPCAEKA